MSGANKKAACTAAFCYLALSGSFERMIQTIRIFRQQLKAATAQRPNFPVRGRLFPCYFQFADVGAADSPAWNAGAIAVCP
jgi:hypothetical protein